MKTLFFRRQLILAVVSVVLAGVLPTQAAKLSKTSPHRTAVFQTASTAKIAVGTNHSATLLDLKVGDLVSITYDQENGALVAHHISDGVPPKPRNHSVHPAVATHHPAKASVYLHVRGIIQSVDVQTGSLTITYKARA